MSIYPLICMAAPESHRLTRQIVIAMLAGMVLGVGLNRLGAMPWIQMFLVDGLLQVAGRDSWRC